MKKIIEKFYENPIKFILMVGVYELIIYLIILLIVSIIIQKAKVSNNVKNNIYDIVGNKFYCLDNIYNKNNYSNDKKYGLYGTKS